MRTGGAPPSMSQEEVDRFLMQQPKANGNPLEMEAMRRELENVAHRNNPLKGDRGELTFASFRTSKPQEW